MADGVALLSVCHPLLFHENKVVFAVVNSSGGTPEHVRPKRTILFCNLVLRMGPAMLLSSVIL
jgi:hypothetical protein